MFGRRIDRFNREAENSHSTSKVQGHLRNKQFNDRVLLTCARRIAFFKTDYYAQYFSSIGCDLERRITGTHQRID